MKLKFLLLLLIPTLCLAQDKFSKIDSLLSYYERSNEWMGSVAISQDGKIAFEKAYGFADVDKKIRADKNTVYKIGSITKTFTAAITFQLIEEGKLDLNTKLSKFYPQIPNADKISVAHLLGHRSGLFNYTNDSVIVSKFKEPITQKQMVDQITSYQSVFEPGTRSEYSNSNYYLLGLIIENLTKKSYAKNLDDRIIKKLKLKRTAYREKPTTNQAFSYNNFGGKWSKEEPWNDSFAFAAGAISGTASDLTIFMKALFDGQIINQESLAEMKKVEDGYGRGIFAIPFYDKKAYGHTGGIEQFASMLSYFPNEKISLSMLSNAKGENNNDIAIGILSLMFDKPFEFPTLEKVAVDTKILKSYEGTYSSSTFPLKLTIVESNGQLTAQASGQPSFTLTTTSETEFLFRQANLKLVFSKDKITMSQFGNSYEFTRE
ncbi:MAG: beta-lactamase family protein [Flavobacterium sp.]|nr:beta-lactamase family protein [Flavobacterium sp.]